MKKFQYYIPTCVLFGQGALGGLHKAGIPGKKGLIVISSGKSTKANGYLARVEEQLELAGCEHVLFDKILPNPVLRHKVWRALNTDEVAEPNAFAMDATLAAFNEGEPWLNELRAYLAGNKATARAMFDKYNASVPADRRIIMVEGHATYLLWVDCSAITHDTDALCDYLKREHKVMFSEGSEYGGNGHDFVRINVACPRARMIEGLARFIDGLLAYRAQSFPKMD